MTISSDILTDPSNHYTIFYAGGALQLRHDFRKGFVEKFSGNNIISKEGIYYLQSSPTSSLVIKTSYTDNKGCEYFCEEQDYNDDPLEKLILQLFPSSQYATREIYISRKKNDRV